MEYEHEALKILSDYLGIPLALADITSESYGFETDELDPSLIPPEYQPILAHHQFAMTHLFTYDNLIAYIIEPYNDTYANQVLLGVIKDEAMIKFKIIDY